MEDFLYAYNQPKKFGKYDLFLDGKITANEIVYKVLTEDNDIENINLADKVKELESRLQTHFTFETVTELPTEGKETVIYLVANDEESGDKDSYNEYMWVKGKGFELIGSGTYAQQKADLQAEIDRASAAETVLTDNLAKEVTDRTDADTALNTKIEAETERATEAEKVLTDNFAQEVTDRTDADTALDEKIDKEIEDRTDADTLIRETVTSITGYPFEKITGDTLSISDELAKRVPYTLHKNVDVVGNIKDVVKLDVPESSKEAMYCPQGLIMGGSALSAGLVTRGICGIHMGNTNTTDDGSCTKENLYINYDGTNTYAPYRQVIIQADNSGEHYGHNLYQYAAARGDAVKGYVDEKIDTETTAREALQEEVTALKSQVNTLEIRIDFLEGQNISENIETNNIEEALVDSFTQPITLNNVVISSPQNLALNKENDVNVSIGSITIDGMTYGDVQTIAEGDSFLATDTDKIFINNLGQIGEKDADGNITKNVIKCKVNVRGNDVDGKEVNVISGVVSITLNGDYKNVETSLYSYLSVLPDGYRRVQYLESTGTQWIDTGVKLSNESEVKCEFQIVEDSVTQYIFGSKTSWLVNDYSLCLNKYSNGRMVINPMVGNKYLEFPYESGKTYSITITTGDVICNNQTKNINNSEIFETPNLCALFGLRYGPASSRIYSFSISRNKQLQLNFIPCLDTTGTPCMYDTVLRKAFYNQGTEDDDFLTDRTLPDGYTELEYLESTDTQWIDTGIKLSNESEVRCEYMLTQDNGEVEKILFGGVRSGISGYVYFARSGSNWYFYCGDKRQITNSCADYGIKVHVITNSDGVTYNGLIKLFPSEVSSFETDETYIFKNAGARKSIPARIYSFSIHRSGVLQADYQPCLDDQGKPCMYDFVSNQPKYNDNQDATSDFLYVLPGTGTETFALRRQDFTSMGSLSKYGLRRIHRLPFNFDGDMDKFISENNIKPIVKTEMPNDGKYYVPQWTQDDEIITLEWIESEPPTIDEITE